jgi:hypothetical protein
MEKAIDRAVLYYKYSTRVLTVLSTNMGDRCKTAVFRTGGVMAVSSRAVPFCMEQGTVHTLYGTIQREITVTAPVLAYDTVEPQAGMESFCLT